VVRRKKRRDKRKVRQLANKSRQLLDRQIDDVVGAQLLKLTGTSSPSAVYHYTGWDGFEGILRERCFRMTDFHCVDDELELRHTDDLMRGVIYRLAQNLSLASPAGRALSNFRRQYPAKSIANLNGYTPFLACFCVAEDDTFMWSSASYGRAGEGYCLGIKLLAEPRDEEIDRRFAPATLPVSYDAKTIEQWIDHGFRQVLTRIGRDGSSASMFMANNAMFRLAAFASLALKGDRFRDEKEWRLVMWVPNNQSIVQVVEGPRRYIVMPLRKARQPIVLDSVHVGAKLGVAGVRRAEQLLGELGYGSEGMPSMPPVLLSNR